MFLVVLLPVLAVIWTIQVLARVNLVTDNGQSIGSFFKLASLILPTIMPFVMALCHCHCGGPGADRDEQ